MRTEMTIPSHKPVLLRESLEQLNVYPGATIVDCTVGLAGHAEAILERMKGRGKLIGLDRDEEALEHAGSRLRARFENFSLHHENFKNLPLILRRMKIELLDGCLLDLGLSSMQVDNPDRGFSFRHDGPLDMRMDQSAPATAADLVNNLSADRLGAILREYGEENSARAIANEIVRERRRSRIKTTHQLANLVSRIRPPLRGQRLHPATKTFQALRLEVNQELGGLGQLLEEVIDLLAPAGRLVVIAFHSLEDRIVKNVFRRFSGVCACFRPPELCICQCAEKGRFLSRRPMTASVAEVDENPRSRSAKLRVFEKRGMPQKRE
jgi:16S rRNA (cytosine1402-N4)-methyltransferase